MYVYIYMYIYIYMYRAHISIFGSAYKPTYIAGGNPAEVMKKSWPPILGASIAQSPGRLCNGWACALHTSPGILPWKVGLFPAARGGITPNSLAWCFGLESLLDPAWSGLLPAFPEQLASNLPRRVERPVTEFALAESTSLNEELLNIGPKYCGYSCPRMSNSKCIWGSSLTSAPFQHQMVGIRRLRAPTSSVLLCTCPFLRVLPGLAIGICSFPDGVLAAEWKRLEALRERRGPVSHGGGWGS